MKHGQNLTDRNGSWARRFPRLLAVGTVLIVVILTSACENAGGPAGTAGRPLEEVEGVTVYDTPGGWNYSVADDGTIWTNNNRGIASYDYESDRWTQHAASQVEAIKEPDSGSILAYEDDIWIAYGWAVDGDNGIGVTRWNPDTTDDYDHYLYPTTPNFPQGPVWSVSKGSDGTIWVGTRFGAGAATFDGATWTPVDIEGYNETNGGRYFDCNSVKHDATGNVYFSTWRGGLHIRNAAGEWMHTDKGAAGGSESFLSRGVYGSDFDFLDDGSVLYVATRNWSHDGTPNDSVDAADGVWKYEAGEWASLTTGVEEASGAVLDERGYLWSTFGTDYRLRYYDGDSWIVIDFGNYQPSSSDFVSPSLVDGDYLWLARQRADGDSQIVRYKYR